MQKRVDYIDVAKLIALALVCFCHIPKPAGYFHIWVYSFHMPLFFLLSGMFFKPEKSSWLKEIRQLLLPFLFFNILAFLISTCINFMMNGILKIPSISIADLVNSKYIIGPSWFLLSLFWIRLLVPFICRIVRLRGLIFLSIIFIGAFLFSSQNKMWNVLSIGSTILGLPFYLVGFLAREKILGVLNYGGWRETLFAIISSMVAVTNGQVGIYNCSYGNNFLAFLFFGLMGTFVLIRLSKYIHIPRGFLNTLMQGSLFYICMHTLMFEYMILIWRRLTGDFSDNTLFEKGVVTILTLLFSYPIIRLMLKYSPILLGKQRKK